MNDFDDQIRASARQIRQRSIVIASIADQTARVGNGDVRTRDSSHRRWLLLAASVAVLSAGLAGLFAATSDRSGRPKVDPAPGLGSVESSGPAATVTAATTATSPSTTASSSTATVPATTVETTPTPALSQPIADPAVCEPFAAIEGSVTGLPLRPGNLPFFLFARPSSLPIPIQVIGNPIDGPARPFAIVERFFALEQPPILIANTVINGNEVQLDTFSNGNGEAIWNLADGTQGYLRSRGLSADDLTEIIASLSPRSADASIPGFDFDGEGPAGLGLVAEQMNTEVVIGSDSGSGSQCRVASTGYVYRVVTVKGDLLYQFASVIDRPTPIDVGVINGDPVIVSGVPDPGAPSIDDIIQADDAAWERLLAPEDAISAEAQSIGTDAAAVIDLFAVGSREPSGSVRISLIEAEGVTNLQIDTANAVVGDAGQFWKIEVDGRLRSRSSATAGGVLGIRLSATPVTTPFQLEFSVTDGDDFTTQTTGLVELQPM